MGTGGQDKPDLMATLDSEGWEGGLDLLCRQIGARSGSVVVFDMDHGLVHYAATGPSQGSLYELVDTGVWTDSTFIRALQPSMPRVIVLPNPRDFTGDPVADSMVRGGLKHHVSVLFPTHDQRTVRVTFERGQRGQPFGGAETALLEQAVPTLIRATRSAVAAAERAAQSALAALERAGVAAALLDATGAVRGATSTAALDMPPWLPSPDGRLRLGLPADQQALAAALRIAAGGGSSRPFRVGEDTPCPLELRLSPAGAERGEGPGPAAACALLLLRPAPGPVGSLAALSPAEIALARLIAEGLPTAEAAQRRGITLKTARTYLERIHAKTGVTSRAGLVALVLAGRPSGR